MEKILGKSPAELETVVRNCGLKPFVAKQIARWLYVSKVRSIDEMTNISKEGREILKSRYEFGASAPIGKAESSDGTLKYLFKVQTPLGGNMVQTSAIESVVIPDGDRSTLCVSSPSCQFIVRSGIRTPALLYRLKKEPQITGMKCARQVRTGNVGPEHIYVHRSVRLSSQVCIRYCPN